MRYCLLFSFIIISTVLLAQTPPAPPSERTSALKVNYVRSWDVIKPIKVSDSIKTSAVITTAKMSTQYLDGLGRSAQTVIKRGSLLTDSTNITSATTARDLISSMVYDHFGREVYQYLPFAADTIGGNSIDNGLFKLNPIQQQVKFYNVQLSGQTGETNVGSENLNWAFSKSVFEESALNRLSQSMAPGSSWVGAGRAVNIKYWVNTATDSVRIWTVTDGTNAGDWGTYTTSSMYASGQLQKTVTVDEHGKQVIEFKDKDGQVVLKKVQLTAPADSLNGAGQGHWEWMCTYYIYDERNRLRAVIQPEGVKTLAANSWSLSFNSGVLLNEQFFRYEYDPGGRMIVKKMPGVGEVYMVYDARDRLVLTQNANLRTGTVKWLYTLYDDLDRPTSTGLLTSSLNRNSHQASAASSISYPNLSGQTYEEMVNSFYDNYNWISNYSGNGLSSSISTTDNNYLLSSSNTVYPYPQAVQQSAMIRGMETGIRVKVLGDTSFLYTINYFDEKGQVVQSLKKNYSGGTDVITTQYSFTGQPLLSILRHEKAGVNPASHVIVTKVSVDPLGRVVQTEKQINGGTIKVLSAVEYNALGQLKKKKLGASPSSSGEPLERLVYDYNIRGWLLGVNCADLSSNGASVKRFAFELGYDKTSNATGRAYLGTQYNGNISGIVWKSAGDGIRRKYDFTFDAANRFMQGSFEEYDDAAWGTFMADYKVKMGDGTDVTTAYDYNGNIKRMQQWGLKAFTISQIDDLTYTYSPYTNKLLNVTDSHNDTATRLGDFRTSKTYLNFLGGSKSTTVTDYSYDNNGNLTQDLNKNISSIAYNVLNLPSTITTSKGTITYTYDAEGNKLKRIVADTNQSSKSTLYMAGAVYLQDTLQFLGHEEGRLRYQDSNFQFDYFLKDHLSNVRMVLTEETQVDQYPPATMETALSNTEESFYSNINSSRQNKPVNYPTDTYSDPNDKVSRIRGSEGGVGPGIVLKVMSGDKFNVRVSSWYKYYETLESTNDPLFDYLLNALSGGILGSGAKSTQIEVSSNSSLNAGIEYFLSYQDNETDEAKPKAFLNWILFDEQLRMVESSSGFDQVGTSDELKIHEFNNLPIHKNGYLYVYVSNAAVDDYVYFDNLQVTHTRGAIVEETHYYPFGLVMDGISSKSANKLQNIFKFNDASELNSELDLNWYETAFRSLDPQIGRFWQVDPISDDFDDLSPYVFANNNPVVLNDPLGLAADTTKTPAEEPMLEGVTVQASYKLLDTEGGQVLAPLPWYLRALGTEREWNGHPVDGRGYLTQRIRLLEFPDLGMKRAITKKIVKQAAKKAGKVAVGRYLVYRAYKDVHGRILVYVGKAKNSLNYRYTKKEIEEIEALVIKQLENLPDNATAVGVEQALIQLNGGLNRVSGATSNLRNATNNEIYREVGIKWLNQNIPNWQTVFKFPAK